MYYGRDLAQLKVLRVTQAGDQLLRLFAARIAFLSLVQILDGRVTVRVILELLNSVVFTIVCDERLLSELLSEVYLEFCNQRYRSEFPCTSVCDFLRDACGVSSRCEW